MKSGSYQFVAASAAFALLLVSCGKAPTPAGKAGAPPTGPARAVKVAAAEARPMERVIGVVGTLSARDEATVAAQVAGQIEKTYVDFGDRVTAGQELALIDTAAYEALVGQSAANLARANSSAANAAKTLNRVQALEKNQIASDSELDQAKSDAAQKQADVKSAEATDAIARLNLDRSHVRAPFDGVIAQRRATTGDYVAPGDAIFHLVKTDPLRLKLEVPERDSVLVRTGQTVRVHMEGQTNIYLGQLARMAPIIRDSDRMLQVEADIPNPGVLRAGIFVRAQIVVNAHEEGVSVPTNAVLVFAGIEKVVLVKEGKVVEKNIATGRRGAGWVEIVSGLAPGEKVVLAPAGLRTGQPVTVESGEAGEPNKVAREGGT